jgi:hypothetical protein
MGGSAKSLEIGGLDDPVYYYLSSRDTSTLLHQSTRASIDILHPTYTRSIPITSIESIVR